MRPSRFLIAFMTFLLLSPWAAMAENTSTWHEPVTGIEFVRVPGGSYEQGCGPWTSDCQDKEKPVRRVTLSPFWLSKTEVTQGQWNRIMGGNPAAFQKGDDYPIETVSWNDVQDFISRLNARSSNETFRLPTEAEWEYACRSGGKPIAYGTQSGEINARQAQYAQPDGPSAVGQFPANGLGLNDMSGNVAEWVQDAVNWQAYQKNNVTNPIYVVEGGPKLLRGGAFFNNSRSVRCSLRLQNYVNNNKDYIGFRLARNIHD